MQHTKFRPWSRRLEVSFIYNAIESIKQTTFCMAAIQKKEMLVHNHNILCFCKSCSCNQSNKHRRTDNKELGYETVSQRNNFRAEILYTLLITNFSIVDRSITISNGPCHRVYNSKRPPKQVNALRKVAGRYLKDV